jgi:hypothetical protein
MVVYGASEDGFDRTAGLTFLGGARSSFTTSLLVNGRGSANTPICRSQENAHAAAPVWRNAMTPLLVGSDTHGL